MPKYTLPIPKDVSVITPDAPFHRQHKNLRHCIDFALPEGTPILAVANGVVIAFANHYFKKYQDPRYAYKANHVILEHAGGEISLYAHLQRQSSQLIFGQRIRQGQQIGKSGQTGFATYPHLHFGIYDAKGNNLKIVFPKIKTQPT